jgi:chaperonin GroES
MATTATTVRIRPLHDRVIVQRLEEGEQKVGGIIIPDTAKEKPQQGKVIAVGKGKVEKDGKVTPSLVIVGEPNFLSRTTLRPLGPSVTLTALASWLTPRRIAWRDSSP